MSSLADAMATICATNNFTTIGIEYRAEPVCPEYTFSVWADWSSSQCVSAYGLTPQEALANAIRAAAEKRAKIAADLDLELAA